MENNVPVDKDTELMNLLRKCEEAARPICFETIDVILRNKDADKIVKELTGMPVSEAYRQKKIRQLDDYLRSLEDLALHWKLINEQKYHHRSKNHGIYNRDMVMFPHRKPNAPYLSSQTLLSSCMKPYAVDRQGKKITRAGKEYL